MDTPSLDMGRKVICALFVQVRGSLRKSLIPWLGPQGGLPAPQSLHSTLTPSCIIPVH